MRRIMLWTIITTALFEGGASAWAQTSPEEAALAQVFSTTGPGFTALFSETMLQQASAEQLMNAVQLYVGTVGAYRSAVGQSGSYDMLFERGKAPARVSLSALREDRRAVVWQLDSV